jgi:uncharacterized protein (DUF1697 family)
MPALRAMLDDFGYQNVRTYVQSGNVVFEARRSSPKSLAGRIEEGVAATFGHDISVIIRNGQDMERIARENPFASKGVPPMSLHVVFLTKAATASGTKTLDPDKWLPDKFEVRGGEIYLLLPNGMGRSKMSIGYFEKALGIRGTARNWNTVNKLRDLVNK